MSNITSTTLNLYIICRRGRNYIQKIFSYFVQVDKRGDKKVVFPQFVFPSYPDPDTEFKSLFLISCHGEHYIIILYQT